MKTSGAFGPVGRTAHGGLAHSSDGPGPGQTIPPGPRPRCPDGRTPTANVTAVSETGIPPTGVPEATRDRSVPTEIIVLSLVAVVLGGVLRFVTRSPLWLDEALSVNIAKLPLGDIGSALRHD